MLISRRRCRPNCMCPIVKQICLLSQTQQLTTWADTSLHLLLLKSSKNGGIPNRQICHSKAYSIRDGNFGKDFFFCCQDMTTGDDNRSWSEKLNPKRLKMLLQIILVSVVVIVQICDSLNLIGCNDDKFCENTMIKIGVRASFLLQFLFIAHSYPGMCTYSQIPI